MTEPTILPVAQQILSHVGLWTDEPVRALVLDNLVDRCGMLFSGMENLRSHFVAEIPKGAMSSIEEAQDIVANVADNITEMGVGRAIGHIRHFMPKEKMSDEEWDAFMETEAGRKLGLFSTVEWWLKPSNPNVKLDPRMARYRQIRREALADYAQKQDYQALAANPNQAINQALRVYRSNS